MNHIWICDKKKEKKSMRPAAFKGFLEVQGGKICSFGGVPWD